MQPIVKSRHTHVPDSLKEMAIHKVEKVYRFINNVTKLEIEFSEAHNPRVPNPHTVEVTLSTKAHLVRAAASGPDPASAVDAVVDKLETQVKRLKEKIRHGRGGSGQSETIRVPSPTGPIAVVPMEVAPVSDEEANHHFEAADDLPDEVEGSEETAP